MKALYVSARSCTVLLDPEGAYLAREPRELTLNGVPRGTEGRSVCSLFGLEPDTDYTLTARTAGGGAEEIAFRTRKETCTLDVRRFGARGDGQADDTAMIQAAICCCPADGRVLIPAGTYRTGPLFLKSRVTLELQKGAELWLETDRARFPILPGNTKSDTPEGEVIMGLWEGCQIDGYAGALNFVEATDAAVIGEGVVDGRAQQSDWWVNPKRLRGAARGNLLFSVRSRGITVQGITFRNSPSWNLHPTFSEDLDFLNLTIQAPWDSPNTDGFDPECCRGVRLLGTEISVGDDCVAIKSGKIDVGRKYKRPCEDIEIGWCAMLDGHGGVTIGSEMAGGVRNVRAHHCYMRGNDRALRIKTRRGRGKDGVVDNILFEQVRMDGVKIALSVNAMYFCDPDGHSLWVQSREKQPVDETTPRLGRVRFEKVTARDCQSCVCYALGLPEQPMEELALKDCEFTFAQDAKPFQPVMADGVAPTVRRGVILTNVVRVVLENVTMAGIEGDPVVADNVKEIIRK